MKLKPVDIYLKSASIHKKNCLKGDLYDLLQRSLDDVASIVFTKYRAQTREVGLLTENCSI